LALEDKKGDIVASKKFGSSGAGRSKKMTGAPVSFASIKSNLKKGSKMRKTAKMPGQSSGGRPIMRKRRRRK
jgi:hypothetical protein